MRFTTGVFVLGLTLNQIQTLAQVIVTQTVSIDTGACAAASRTGGPGGSGVGDSNGGPSGGPIPPPGVPTTVDISYGVFYFAGFYALPTTGNLLDGASTSSPTASLESCGSFCGRSSYFALEQGDICLCGSSAPTTAFASNPSPLTPCPGASNEICGSPGYGIVYTNSLPRSGSSLYAYTSTEPNGVVTIGTAASYYPITSSSNNNNDVHTTTNSLGSTVVETGTGASSSVGNTPPPYFTYITATDSLGSTIVQTNTVAGTLATSGPETYASYVTTVNSAGSIIVQTQTLVKSPTSSALQIAGTSLSGSNPSPSSIPIGGRDYQISYGVDYPGNDLKTPHVNSLNECLQACSDYIPDQTVQGGKPCIAAAFGAGNVGGNCYLKYAITEVNVGNGGFSVGRNIKYDIPQSATTDSLVQYPSPTSKSATASAIAISTPANQPTLGIPISGSFTVPDSLLPVEVSTPLASTGPSSAVAASISMTSAGSSIAVGPSSSPAPMGSSSSGVVSASPAADPSSSSGATSASSIANAASSPGAAGGSLTAIATSSSPAASNTPSDAVVGTSKNAPGTSAGTPASTGGSPEPTVQDPAPNCGATPPVGNNTRFSDQFATTYDIRCALGVEGDNADVDAHADTFPRCLEYCSLLEGCVAVTYLDGNSQNNDNSNCYPYYSFRGYSTGGPTGVYSGVDVDGASPGAVGSTDLCGADAASLNAGVFGPDTFGNCYQVGCGEYQTYTRTLFATDMTTLEGCLTYCSIYDTCIAVNWLGPHVIGTRDQANCIPIAATSTVSSGVGAPTAYAVQTPCA